MHTHPRILLAAAFGALLAAFCWRPGEVKPVKALNAFAAKTDGPGYSAAREALFELVREVLVA